MKCLVKDDAMFTSRKDIEALCWKRLFWWDQHSLHTIWTQWVENNRHTQTTDTGTERISANCANWARGPGLLSCCTPQRCCSYRTHWNYLLFSLLLCSFLPKYSWSLKCHRGKNSKAQADTSWTACVLKVSEPTSFSPLQTCKPRLT